MVSHVTAHVLFYFNYFLIPRWMFNVHWFAEYFGTILTCMHTFVFFCRHPCDHFVSKALFAISLPLR